MLKRELTLPKNPKQSFFLWGPRQSGKSTLLKERYPNAHWIDLLNTDAQIKYLRKPWLLREELLRLPKVKLVIIDEIQKVPQLLDEVHWLMENKKVIFGLCGSSARKVKRGHANLLGGRAIRYQMHGLVAPELKEQWDVEKMLNRGYMPTHYLSKNPEPLLQSYISDYLKEEIAQEGLVRSFPAFSGFLETAALGDTEMVNYSNIARERGISVPTVKGYYSILEDTLLGTFVQAFQKRPKRRLVQTPKFYFEDVGVVNTLARRGHIQRGGELFGKALENWVFHELNSYNHYRKRFASIAYWRTSGGVEVDFVINNAECAIEVKASSHISDHHLKGLREMMKDYKVKKSVLVSSELVARRTADGIHILPIGEFVKELWAGKLF